jgi:drug/metabolite transporter (DMT)-like permease
VNDVTDPRRGYVLAVVNMLISGAAIFVNSLGVKMFADSTLYTALKNCLVGVVLLVPFVLSPRSRLRLAATTRPQALLLLLVALIGGSVPYALYFRGLQLSTPVTASLIDHTQFLLVAIFAGLFLGERLGVGVWAALGVLLAGLTLGIGTSVVSFDAGTILIAAATVLFAADFVVMKHLLGSVSPLTVMTFKMGLGSALLLAYVAASGSLGMVTGLSLLQWGFILATGLILLAFTATSVLGLRHASATSVTAISAGSPIVTTALVLVSRHASIPPVRWIGLSLILAAVCGVFILGRRRETRRSDGPLEGGAT